MNWLINLFKKKNKSIENHPKYLEGLEAYKKADQLFHEKNFRDEKVLEYYDKAIESGINEAYADRAFALQALEYHYEAIEDFDNAITLYPDDPNLYFGRATSKKSLYNLNGSVEDLELAIKLIKNDSSQKTELDARANKIGWRSALQLYEFTLSQDLLELKYNMENPEIANDLKALNSPKRRVK